MFLAFLYQAATPPRAPLWYEQATGILAVPAALIGLAYSYVLIKKTRLEARKTELEIREKEKALSEGAGWVTVPHATASAPLFTFRIGNLVLRYILLELILSLSSIVRTPIQWLFKGIGYGTYFGLDKLMPRANIPMYLGVGITQLGNVTDTVLYWGIFLLVGWPLFKDTLAALGVSTSDVSVRSVLASMKNWKEFTRKLKEAK